MYYDVVTSLDELLGYEGILRLPPYLPKVFVMDDARRSAIDVAKKYLDSGQNVLLIGEPGTGKTALMFIILAELKKSMKIAYILEGATSIGKKHEEEGIVLFYDDIPRMNRDALRSIMKNRVRMILATARKEELEFLKRVTGIDLLKEFGAIEVPPMSKEKLREMLLRYVAEEAIRIADKEAVDEVIEKAGGLPVYIWQVIRELRIRKEPLTLGFAKTIPQGMLDYIDDILWRTLGGQPERYEALITLLCMTDFIKYAVHQDLYNYIYLRAKELRTKRRVTLDEIMLDETLEAISRYLARESATYSFRLPHDSWADVLRGKSRGPMASEISKINMVFPKRKRISIVLEAARRAWSETLEEAEDIFRKDAFKNNIVLNLGKEAWNDIQKRTTPETLPTAPIPTKLEAITSITGLTDPLKGLKQQLADVGVAPKKIIAKGLGISEAELESLIDIADFVIESKRKGFIYHKDYYNKAIQTATNQLKTRGWIRIEETAKSLKIFPEDLTNELKRRGYLTTKNTAWNLQKIVEILQQHKIITTQIIQQKIHAKLETIREILEKIAYRSLKKDHYYNINYLKQTLNIIWRQLQQKPWLTKEEIIAMGILEEDVDRLLEDIAEKSPTNSKIYYLKGKIEQAQQKIEKLIKLRKVDSIAQKLGITIEDTKQILQQKGYKIKNNTVITLGKEALETLKPLLRDEYRHVRLGAALGVGLAFQGTGKREAIETLKPLLRDKDWAMRRGAALGVGLAFQGTGKREAIETLKPLLKDKYGDVRLGAALGVGLAFQGTGKREAIETLKPLLRDKDWATRFGAALGVGLAFQRRDKIMLVILFYSVYRYWWWELFAIFV